MPSYIIAIIQAIAIHHQLEREFCNLPSDLSQPLPPSFTLLIFDKSHQAYWDDLDLSILLLTSPRWQSLWAAGASVL